MACIRSAPAWLVAPSERHPVGKAVLRSSGGLVRLARAQSPALRATRTLISAFANVAHPARRKALAQISGIGYRYPAPRGSHPLTGTRAPDAPLRTGRLYESLRTGHFLLITPAPYEPPSAPRTNRLTVAHWTDARRTTLLIRPDAYIAWAADSATPTAIEPALTAHLG